MDKTLNRVNVRITADLHDWYKERAASMGLNVNALMVMALNAYHEQQTVLPQLPRMIALMEQGEAAKRKP